MGQQQLLLLVLGVIIVGLAVVVGLNFFRTSSIETNRTAIIEDLNNLASISWAYKKKPTNLGGGGNSFVGFEIPTGLSSNANGTFRISSAGTLTTIGFEATGTEIGDNGTSPVKFIGIVTPEKINITKVN